MTESEEDRFTGTSWTPALRRSPSHRAASWESLVSQAQCDTLSVALQNQDPTAFVPPRIRLQRIALRMLDHAARILATLPVARDDHAVLLRPLFCPRTACRRSRVCKRASACLADDARARDALARYRETRSHATQSLATSSLAP